jgi:hypothetical protein
MSTAPAYKEGVLSTGTHHQESLVSTSPPTEGPEAWHSRGPSYRTTLLQILVVSTCAFRAPQIWSATHGLGVGGSQSLILVNAANAALYAWITLIHFAGLWMTN